MASFALFKSDLSKVCGKDELRPALSIVHFSNGYAYATNAHALVRQSLAWMEFTPEDIAILNGKSLTVSGFKLAKTASVLDIREEFIVARVKDTVFQIDYADTALKFPDAEILIRSTLESQQKSIDEFGISPNILKTLFFCNEI